MRLRLTGLVFLLCIVFFPLVARAATTVTISPGYTNLGVNATLRYTATVKGITNTTVSWVINGIVGGNSTLGTITSGGLYKAPAAIPSASILVGAIAADGTLGEVYVNLQPAGPIITAVNPNPVLTGNPTLTLVGTGFKPGATVSLNGNNLVTTYVNATTLTTSVWQLSPGTGVIQAVNPGTLWGPPFTVTFVNPQAISPLTASLKLGATKQFTSAGATSWTATAGTVSSSGFYTAPVTMPATGKATITATGPGGSASATVTLSSPTPQTISPKTASVSPGATQQFTSSGATSWTATAGTISSTGLYTAPSVMPASSTVTVTATGPNGSASATVTLTGPAQAISPSSASVNLGATQQFASAGATSWSATYGTVSATGLYTAPSALSPSGTDTVTATGPNGSAKAPIVLIPPTPTITGVGGGGQLPLGIFNTTLTGTGFTSGAIASLNGVALVTTYTSPTSLSILGFAGQSGQGSLTVSNGSVASQAFSVQVGVQNALASPAAARRFLEQAAFGPTPTDAQTVQTLGIPGWISAQISMPQVSNYDSDIANNVNVQTQFLANAVTNPDQLRQRVAFALSQIFVTSLEKLIFDDDMVPYQDMLLADSFTNYRKIMEDVTLSGAMGQYLDMGNNAKADPTTGAVANENYARELMQLFTIGTVMLNPDGTMQLNASGMPIPTYTQPTVAEFARVYTGWTYAPTPGNAPYWGEYYSGAHMIPWPSEHDMGSKQLLNGYVAPAGLTNQQDLDAALDNIFNHPNVGPFVSKLLIQHLVKSNPSPAYVSRVAAAFNNNGSGVRGDMTATITAILLDPEARANDNGGNDQPTDGHLQEPALFMAGMVRAFGGQMTTQNYYLNDLANMGQDVFDSPSVFNFYAPTSMAPGTTLMGGEFQIFTPNNAVLRANEVADLFSSWGSAVQTNGPGTTIDLTPFLPLAANPATLVSALDLTLTHGTMPTAMKSQITSAIAAETNGPIRQVQLGAYLILTSNYYNVWH